MDSDTLYHGTSAAALAEILHTDSILCHDTHNDGFPLGFSLTRDPNVSADFADLRSSEAVFHGEGIAPGDAQFPPSWAEAEIDGTGGVLLVVDRSLLLATGLPLVDLPSPPDDDEQTERLVAQGELIVGITAAIRSVTPADPVALARFADTLEARFPDYGPACERIRELAALEPESLPAP